MDSKSQLLGWIDSKSNPRWKALWRLAERMIVVVRPGAKQCVTRSVLVINDQRYRSRSIFNVQRSLGPPSHLVIHLAKSWTRLWVVHTRQLDFESVVLFSHTTLLNQTLSRSTSPPYILLYYSSTLFTTITLFTKTLHRHWSHPPISRQSASLSFSPVCSLNIQYWFSLISQGFNVCSS